MPIAFGEPFSFDQSMATQSPDRDAFSPNAQTEIHTRVLIIGAGLAGLTCAYRYAQALERPVTRDDLLVLEREPSVGGRVRSLKIGSTVLNLGAVTFQPSAYPRYMALLNELGLHDRVYIIPRREMVLGIDQRSLYANNLALAADGFRGLVGRGVFTPAEAVQLLRFYFYLRRVTSPKHFDELLALQDRSVASWASEFGFSETVKHKFIEPFIGFTFSAPETVSAAFGVLLLGFNLSNPANLRGGMMQLPEAMAARLGNVIEPNAQVVRVERKPGGFITTYCTANQAVQVHSQAFVAAVPANVAASLVPEMRARAASLEYGSGSATLLQGKLKQPGNLQLWRVDSAEGSVIYGGEAQTGEDGLQYFNLLTYRSKIGVNAKPQTAPIKSMFVDGKYEELLCYNIHPAVAAPAPNQKPLPLDWGDGLFMAGDATGIFPSQEAAVSSGEEVARHLGDLTGF